MNQQFRIAEATGAGNSDQGSQARIFKLTKPFTDQAVVINLGYDQKVQVDFSSIANEKITLVHVGEKLIILFDNQSTVTIEPFFDSRHDQSGNLTIEVAPGRDLTVSEFASAFPIVTDQSILPAAGPEGTSAQGSGANFSNPTVDPLTGLNPLDLLPPEEIPGGGPPAPPTGFVPTTTTLLPPPTIIAATGVTLQVDESFIPGVGSFVAVAGSPASNIATEAFDTSFTVTAAAGVKSIAYALNIDNPVTTLIDSISGLTVSLVAKGTTEVDGVVTIKGVQTTVFTLTVDATGHVTFTELRGVHEGTPGDFNEGTTLPSGLISLSATVTDNNNLTATASLDLGHNITIHDDGPSITLSGTIGALNTSETYLSAVTNGVNGTTPDASPTQGHALDTENFAGVFTVVAGADGAASTTYALAITANGTPTNLIDSATGLAVVLDQTGNTVSGYVTGHEGNSAFLVFTLTVNPSTGDVTLTQDRAVHEGTGEKGGDIGEGISLTSGLVTLSVSVTDNDGDKATQGIDLGAHVTFHDDGPSISVTSEREFPFLSVDESGLPTGSDSAHPEQTTDTVNLAGAFTSVQGADGATITYAMAASAASATVGVDTKLIDSATGHDVFLFLQNGEVVGRQGTDATSAATGDIVFTLSVVASGVDAGDVTLTQFRAVHEPDTSSNNESIGLGQYVSTLVQVTATITDADGDSDTASFDLTNLVRFHDDGPSAGFTLTTTTVSIDETAGIQQNDQSGSAPGLFPAAYGTPIEWAQTKGAVLTDTSAGGADGTASVTYALTTSTGAAISGADSGFKATATGREIFLFTENGLIVGREGTSGGTADSTGKVAFAIGLDGSNNLDVALYEALKQTNTSDPNDIDALTGKIYVTQTVTDHDGDTATSTSSTALTVNFYDDGPTAGFSLGVTTVSIDESSGIQQNDHSGSAPSLFPAGYGTPIQWAQSTAAVLTDTSSGGADGKASVVYALTNSTGAAISGVDSGFKATATGREIFLFTENGLIVGREGNSNGTANSNGKVAFAIGLDGSNNLDVALYEALKHTDTSNPNDIDALTGKIYVTQTVTDGDGDKATATSDTALTVNFYDDGPTAGFTLGSNTVSIDESSGTQQNDHSGSAPSLFNGYGTPIQWAQSTSSVIASDTSTGGADGKASVSYALTGATGLAISGVDSGIRATATGREIFLFTENGLIVGREGNSNDTANSNGKVAFAIGLDGSNKLDVALYEALKHTDTTNPNDIDTLTGKIYVTQTVTDGDGDKATATSDTALTVKFYDDGPTAGFTLGNDRGDCDDDGHLVGTVVSIDESAGLQQNDHSGSAPSLFPAGYGTPIQWAQSSDPVLTDTSSGGADGKASVVYALTTSAGNTINGVDSGIRATATGREIFLFTENGLIVGREGNSNDTANSSGKVAFAIGLDGSNKLDVALYEALKQTDTSDSNDYKSLTNKLYITQTVTDGDGDKDTFTSNDALTVRFYDDGPTAGFTAGATTVSIDETAGIQPNDHSGSAPGLFPAGYGTPIQWAQSTSAVVTSDTSTGGADGKASVSYSLTNSSGNAINGVDSGIKATGTGREIFLFTENGLIVGREGTSGGNPNSSGKVAFAIGLDGSNNLDVALYEALKQSDTSDPNDFKSLTGKIYVTQTVTDGDGDTDTATSGTSLTVKFYDDGPTAGFTAGATTVSIDESSGIQPNDHSGSAPSLFPAGYGTPIQWAQSTSSVVGSDTSSGGADGKASVVYALTNSFGNAINGVDSGIKATATGREIFLFTENGLIVGREGNSNGTANSGGKVAFAIGLDGSNNLDVALYEALKHGDTTNPNDIDALTGKIYVTQTVTDGDGDTATSTAGTALAVNFYDDGPTAGFTAGVTSVSIDESSGVQPNDHSGSAPSLFPAGYGTPIQWAQSTGAVLTDTSSGGADGKASVSYALTGSTGAAISGVDSGIRATATGREIFLFTENGLIVGREGNSNDTANSSGKVAFAIGLDGSNKLDVALYEALKHGDTTNPNDIDALTGKIFVTQTVTDGDGDTATSTSGSALAVNFYDDGPTAGFTLGTSGGDCDDDGNLVGTVVSIDETSGQQQNDHSGSAPGLFPAGYGTPIQWAQSSSALLTDTSSGGADGKALVTYALTTSGGNTISGVDSGIKATASGREIFLFTENGLIVGREADSAGHASATGTVAFAIGLDSSNRLDVALYEALKQSDTSDSNDYKSLANKLYVTQTVTDGDGDTDTFTSNDALTVRFYDDGPTAAFTAGATSVSIDETAGIQPNDQSGSVPSLFNGYGTPIQWAQSTTSVVGSDNSTGGADGKASVTYSLTTSGGNTINGVDSGIKATGTGREIFLFTENGLIVGREGNSNGSSNSNGKVAFAIGLDGSNKLDVALYEALKQTDTSDPNDVKSLTGKIYLTQTVTDGDGDTDTATSGTSLAVNFYDDGPTAGFTAGATSVSIDETAGIQPNDQSGSVPSLFNGYGTPIQWAQSTSSVIGADNSSGGADGKVSVSYSLTNASGNTISAVDSGFKATGTGREIFLFTENGLIVGREGNSNGTANSNGKVAFAIGLDGNNKLDVALYEALKHTNTSDANDIDALTNKIYVTQTVTDGDGDTSTASSALTVNFYDDGPTAGFTAGVTAVSVDESAGIQPNDQSGSVPSLFNGYGTPIQWAQSTGAVVGSDTSSGGADGKVSVTYALTGAAGVAISAVDSGFKATASGREIFLFTENGLIVGREGNSNDTANSSGKVAFVIGLDSNNKLDVALYEALKHDDTTSANDIDALTGKIYVTQSVTDGDGDVATASSALTVNFYDDGPTAGFTAGATTVSIDESAGIQPNDQSAAVPSLFPAGYGTPIQWAQSTASVVGSDTSAGGADGKASVSYALTSLTGAAISGVDSGIRATATGREIFLFTENGVIVGREGNSNDTADSSGKVAFAIGLDGSNNLDVALYEALKQTNGSDPNDFDTLTGKIYVTQTVTDGDGDKDTSTSATSLTIKFYDDGPSITAHTTSLGTLSVDESFLSTGSTPNSSKTSATADFGTGLTGAFTAVAGADGATVTYALSAKTATATVGVDSGLIVSSTGHDVYLFLQGGDIVGRDGNSASGAEVFRLHVDASGTVTLTQSQAVHELVGTTGTSPAVADNNDAIPLDNYVTNLVTLTATITDNDGDTQSASIDLSHQVSFKDDGPSITLSGTGVSLLVDESGLPTGSDSAHPSQTTDTEHFAAAFSSVAGADGASVTYALTASGATSTVGVDSKLIDSATGNHVYLFLEGGQVVGREGTTAATAATNGPIVFSLSVVTSGASAGDVTLTQFRAVHEGSTASNNEIVTLDSYVSNLVQLTATITDADGDHESTSLDLSHVVNLRDDGPTAGFTAGATTVSIDETAGTQQNDQSAAVPSLFPVGYGTPIQWAQSTSSVVGSDTSTGGADGKASVSYALTGSSGAAISAVDSGFKATATGREIFLFTENGLIVGREGNSSNAADAAGKVAFAIGLDASNNLDVALYEALKHGDTTNANDIDALSGKIYLTQTVTDGDGDAAKSTAATALTVNFYDDGPTGIIPDMAVLLNTAGKTFTGALDIDTNIDNNYGADGAGSLKFSSSLNNADSGLTSGGKHILYSVSADGHTLTGYLDTNGSGTFNSGDTTVFTIGLNLDGSVNTSTDTYTLTMVGTVDGGAGKIDFSNGGYNFVGGNTAWVGFTNTNSSSPGYHQDLLVTPMESAIGFGWYSGGTVNGTSHSLGVGGGTTVGPGEGLRLDYVTQLAGSPGSGSDYVFSGNQNETYTGHYLVNGATVTFDINPNKSSTVDFVALDDTGSDGSSSGGSVTYNEGTHDSITSVTINFGTGSQSVLESTIGIGHLTHVTVGSHDFTVEYFLDSGGHTYAEIGNIVDNTVVATFTANGYNAQQVTYADGDAFAIGDFGAPTTTAGSPVDLSVPLTITDGDGDTAVGSINAYLLPSSPTTTDWSTSSSAVTKTASTSAPDIIGSAFGDTLNGDSNANVLYGGAGDDTLKGMDGNDTLIGGAGNNTLTGGNGADKFIILNVDGTEKDNITDFSQSDGDQIYINIGAGFTLDTAPAVVSGVNFSSGTNMTTGFASESASTNKFFLNTSSGELFFSADGTVAHAIDLAHIGTGVPAANIHTV